MNQQQKFFLRTALFTSIFAANGAIAEIEEIIVTAQKRAENTQHVPITINAMSESMIEDRGVSDLKDLWSAAPGVSGYESPASRGNINVTMRGIGGGDSGNLSLDPAVGIYIDGVFLGKAAGNGVDAMDLERIEVLKGPQGTLYGRNSTAGAMNFVTKKPAEEFGVKLKGYVGNYNERNVSGRVDLPVSDSLGVSLSGYTRDRDHLYDNTRAGGDGFENLDRQGFRLSTQWRGDAVTVDYSYAQDEIDENTPALDVTGFNPLGAGVLASSGNFGSVATNSTDRIAAVTTVQQYLGAALAGYVPGVTPNTNMATAYGWMSNYLDWANGQLEQGKHKQGKGSSDIDPYSKTTTKGHALTVSWDAGNLGVLGDVEFKSITGYRDMDNESLADMDGMDNSVDGGVIGDLQLLAIGSSYLNGGFQGTMADAWVDAIIANGSAPVFNTYKHLEHQQFSQEFQMIGSTDNLKYVVGLYYYDDESTVRGNNQATFPLSSSTMDNYDQSAQAWSIFSQATWSPNSESPWAFTAGVRYTEEDKDVVYLWRQAPGINPLLGALTGTYVSDELAETQPAVEGVYGKKDSENFYNVSGSLTAQYFFNDDVNAFLTYSTGYRSGGFNGGLYDLTNDAADAFEEETIKNWELGLKSDVWEGTGQLNLTVFQYEYENLQLSELLPQDNGSVISAINNAGLAKRYGAELGFQWAATDSLLLGLNYTYMHGDFDEYAPVANPSGGPALNTDDLAVRSQPANQLGVNVDWRLFEGNGSELKLVVNAMWQTESAPIALSQAVYDSNNDGMKDTPVVFKQTLNDERTLVNSRLAWTSALADNRSLTVALWGRNLLDEEYRTFGFNLGDALGSQANQYGEPRTWGVEVIWEM